jgi:acetyl esterase/lipase
VRNHAEEWGIDPKRVGILGFSAGGHLSAMASTSYQERTYPRVDAADDQNCRPDFTVLLYPAYLVSKEQPTQLSPIVKVDTQTPPAFLVHAQDDRISVENSIFYYLGLKNANVPAELHLFPTGGHGYGLRQSEHSVTGWPKLAEQWMRSRGILRKLAVASLN